MTFESEAKLVDRIDAAFPDGVFVGDAVGCICVECRALATEVTTRPWRSFSEEEVRWLSAGASLFGDAAFDFFLPAYMRASLTDPDQADVATEGAAGVFLPWTVGGTPYRKPGELSSLQRGVLFDWLEWYIRGEERNIEEAKEIPPADAKHAKYLKRSIEREQVRIDSHHSELARLRATYPYED